MLICETESEFVPAEIKEKYGLAAVVGNLEIYVADDNAVYKMKNGM